MGVTRQSHPIDKKDLDVWKASADKRLADINGKNIQDVLIALSKEEPTWLMEDELRLIFVKRRAVCLFFYFMKLLKDRTEIGKEKELTPVAQRKAVFCSAYALFAMSASITLSCNKFLRGKDEAKLAHFDIGKFEPMVGKGFERDLNWSLSYWVGAITSSAADGANLVQNSSDLVSITRDYWKSFGDKMIAILEKMSDFLPLIENTTFHHGLFVLTGLAAEYKREAQPLTWKPVTARELVGDPDVTVLMEQQCQKLALFDPIVGKNPVCELGGLLPSILMDGPPGSGKTTRMRFMMTTLARFAEMVGIPCAYYSITADQVKNEFYGKTAQLLAQRLAAVLDPHTLSLLFVDDVDLLLSGDRDAAGTNGADKDIMSGLMNFFSGASTNYVGTYIALAATNKPMGLDPALRQRFAYCAFIDGPKTAEDYADLVAHETSGLGKNGLLKVAAGRYQPHSRELSRLIAKDTKSRSSGGNWDDIGKLCQTLREKDPNFTGRPVKNAIEVAKAKAANFDVPKEWFENPEVFRAKPWNERIDMLRGLYQLLTAEQIMTAIQLQFDNEQRYRSEAREKQIEEAVERLRIQEEAIARLKGGVA